MKYTLLLLTLSIICQASMPPKQSTEVREDFKKFYDSFKVDGSFVLYNPQENKYILFNQGQSEKQLTPASTFKICNSLIGLETGVIKDENYVIPWDKVVHKNEKWNSDQDLKTAFKNSTVWYFQELARRVGSQKMKYWLEKARYGNTDTSGGIDQFWLSGGLRISSKQQIEFLKRLHDNELPFSKRSMNIVKKIMIVKDTLGYVVRAKTGWGENDKINIGLFVGYFEIKGNVYYFVNCIRSADGDNINFGRARIEIVYEIFKNLGLIN